MAEKLYCEVKTKIKQYVLQNDLKAGDKLPSERMLAESFNVGRNIVREALKLLSEERVIEIRERAGAYVLDSADARVISSVKEEFMSDAADLKGVLEVRRFLEPFVIRKCIDNITPQQFDGLQRLQDAMRECGSSEVFAKLNIAFHEKIAESTGNSALSTIMCMLYNVLGEKIFYLPYSDSASVQETLWEHELLLKAIQEKDYKKGVEYIIRHVDNGERDLDYLSRIGAETAGEEDP